MRREVVPMATKSAVRDRERSNGGRSLRLVNALSSRLLSYGIARDRNTKKPDAELVRLASALLQIRTMSERSFGPTLSIGPLWLLLLIYIRQAEGPGVTVSGLSKSAITGPDTVTLRWTTKLLNDRNVQLVDNSERPLDPVVQLSPDGFEKLESWLRASKGHLEGGS